LGGYGGGPNELDSGSADNPRVLLGGELQQRFSEAKVGTRIVVAAFCRPNDISTHVEDGSQRQTGLNKKAEEGKLRTNK